MSVPGITSNGSQFCRVGNNDQSTPRESWKPFWTSCFHSKHNTTVFHQWQFSNWPYTDNPFLFPVTLTLQDIHWEQIMPSWINIQMLFPFHSISSVSISSNHFIWPFHDSDTLDTTSHCGQRVLEVPWQLSPLEWGVIWIDCFSNFSPLIPQANGLLTNYLVLLMLYSMVIID